MHSGPKTLTIVDADNFTHARYFRWDLVHNVNKHAKDMDQEYLGLTISDHAFAQGQYDLARRYESHNNILNNPTLEYAKTMNRAGANFLYARIGHWELINNFNIHATEDVPIFQGMTLSDHAFKQKRYDLAIYLFSPYNRDFIGPAYDQVMANTPDTGMRPVANRGHFANPNPVLFVADPNAPSKQDEPYTPLRDSQNVVRGYVGDKRPKAESVVSGWKPMLTRQLI